MVSVFLKMFPIDIPVNTNTQSLPCNPRVSLGVPRDAFVLGNCHGVGLAFLLPVFCATKKRERTYELPSLHIGEYCRGYQGGYYS